MKAAMTYQIMIWRLRTSGSIARGQFKIAGQSLIGSVKLSSLKIASKDLIFLNPDVAFHRLSGPITFRLEHRGMLARSTRQRRPLR